MGSARGGTTPPHRLSIGLHGLLATLASLMATLYVRDVPAALHRRFKLLCVTRGRSIRAEVIRLIGEELGAVDDIEVALGAVLGPTPKRR